jgi:hypothetical protein
MPRRTGGCAYTQEGGLLVKAGTPDQDRPGIHNFVKNPDWI